jgi:hypothetical protein
MTQELQLQPPEECDRIDWNRFMDNLVGFNTWVGKNREKHYQNRNTHEKDSNNQSPR